MRFWLYIEGIENKFLILGLYVTKLELVNPPKAWSSFKDQTKTSLLKSRSFDFLPVFWHTNAHQNNPSSANISTNTQLLMAQHLNTQWDLMEAEYRLWQNFHLMYYHWSHPSHGNGIMLSNVRSVKKDTKHSSNTQLLLVSFFTEWTSMLLMTWKREEWNRQRHRKKLFIIFPEILWFWQNSITEINFWMTVHSIFRALSSIQLIPLSILVMWLLVKRFIER